MTTAELLQHRLINQQLTAPRFSQPDEVVAWMGAMQAQEYAHAKWAVGLRLPGASDADVENSFNTGTILRTHLMRPTWHFVSPADIRWLLALTAPRVHAVNAFMYRKVGLDSATIRCGYDVLVRALEGGRHRTRPALKEALAQANIVADGFRLGYLLMGAELDGVLCSGPRQGKQFSYALLDERVPATAPRSREEALAELTRRYFTSHGPATLADFAWWSGLTLTDARAGMALLGPLCARAERDGQTYFFAAPTSPVNEQPTTFLMPDYDEYGISYKNRSALFATESSAAKGRELSPYAHLLVIDGVIGGTWQRTGTGKNEQVEATPFGPLTETQGRAVQDAVERYRTFAASGV